MLLTGGPSSPGEVPILGIWGGRHTAGPGLMKIPKSITMAGVPLRIIMSDLSDDDCFGFYSHDRKVIEIDKTLTGKRLHDTIRHEMLEAALTLSGVGFYETYEQEAICRCMDEIFFPAWDRVLRRFNK